MFNRRNLLSGTIGTFIGSLIAWPFFCKQKVEATYIAPFEEMNYFNLGKMLNATISNSGMLGCMFEQPLNPNIRHIQFPIETHLSIEYENGSEEWVTFNYKTTKIKDFNKLAIATSRANIDIDNSKYAHLASKVISGKHFIPSMLYDGHKFIMSSISKKC